MAKKNRPKETNFNQQNLRAWQPVLTAGTVSPIFIAIGVVCFCISVIIRFFDNSNEMLVDYTNCTASEPYSNVRCLDVINDSRKASCRCKVPFSIEDEYGGQIYIYYALTSFYQNHRLYIKSKDDTQLRGKLSTEVSADCYPYDYVTNRNGIRIPIAPCGAIANSFFTDEINLKYNHNGTMIPVPVKRKGIAWTADKDIKFRNPPGDLKTAFKWFAKPPTWKKHIWQLDLEDPSNNGFQNEDFIVWMRPASTSDFRKIYRFVDHQNEPFKDGLPKGNYSLDIMYSYPLPNPDGTKGIIISTMSVLGGRNPFLGRLYIAVSAISMCIGIFFLILRIWYEDKHLPTNNWR